MNVTHFESGRFWVASETTRGKKYLVDIMGFDERWWTCSCPDFQIRILPRLEAGIRPTPDDICKHCAEVVEFLGQRVIEKMKKQATNLTGALPGVPDAAKITTKQRPG